MAEVTEADRERAAQILTGDVDYHVVRDAIAAALAEERERAYFQGAADALAAVSEEFEPDYAGEQRLASRVVHKLRYRAAMARSGDFPSRAAEDAQ